MKTQTVLLIAIVFSRMMFAQNKAVPAQAPFGLKGDLIGESMQGFRDNHLLPGRSNGEVYPICSGDALTSPVNGEEAALAVVNAGAHAFGEDQECFASPPAFTTIAGNKAALQYYFKAGRLDLINGSFDRSGYANARHAIEQKYGPPTQSEAHTYSTRAGGQIVGNESTWSQDNSVIMLREVCPWNVESSSLGIFSPRTQADQAREKRDKAASDF